MSLLKSITVIPYRVWIGPNGRRASIYGASPLFGLSIDEHAAHGWTVEQRGYTWECLHNDGSVTYGLCRPPAKTIQEAQEIANKVMSI